MKIDVPMAEAAFHVAATQLCLQAIEPSGKG